jgi:MSHA biogenesis protein MshM
VNYLKHFGLRELPFGITPDTSYFFACRSIQEALNTLLIAVSNGEGFIKITGEVGTGKTLLCRKFLSTLGPHWVSAYIPNPNLEPRGLLLALAEELGVGGDPIEPHRLEKELMQRLLDIARQGKRVVLCMDETQAMPLATLETVRLLTNLETEKRKLMQVVLFGQPELDRKLASEAVRQLRQRITFQHALKALAQSEVAAYVAHRLTIAG